MIRNQNQSLKLSHQVRAGEALVDNVLNLEDKLRLQNLDHLDKLNKHLRNNENLLDKD